MTYKRDSRCFVLALAAWGFVRVDKVAVFSVYINVPLSTYCKIR